MFPQIARLAEPLNPFRANLSEAEAVLRTFRIVCAFVVGLIVPFGWLYHASGAALADPMAVRWAIMAGAGVLLALTFRSRRVARHALRLSQAMTYGLMVYFGWLAYAHDLSSGYGVGYLFVFTGLAMAHSLSYSRPAPFAAYLGLSTIVAIVVAAAVETPGVPRAVFVLCTVSSAAVLLLTVGARLSLMRSLAESETHLAEAQGAAGLGSWQKDLRTGAVRWSVGMFRLTGYDAATTTPSAEAFVALAHPDDRAGLTDLTRLLDPATPDTDEMTIRYRRHGSAARRHADVTRTLVRDAEGRAVRAFGSVQDTTDARDREAALREALRQAQDAARAKSAFLANMSHEIRTPLTAILGFAELLGEETGGDHRDLVEPIESAGQRLLLTLNSVLDLARMEAGEADLDLVPVDLAAETRAAASLLTAQAAGKGVQLHVRTPDAPLRVLGDAAALSRVIVNLTSNAVKFTARGSVTVEAAACTETSSVRLVVCDTGRGMDAAFLSELFEPFRQASTGWARSHEGTGLGLTIVKRLVEGMRGTIGVESTPGVGTCFTVALPLAAPEPAAPEPAVAEAATAPAPAAA